MTHSAYPAPPRPTIDDLDPESTTTDRLIAMVHSHRTGEDYPHPSNCSSIYRSCCGRCAIIRLSGEATALDAAYRLASIIDAVEGCQEPPDPSQRMH
ncbi:MAG: hypothetical protein IPL99_07115 [Candidatus Competibacteraceae bacterium]|nr:hypothetical protein [Candidatus Competibacteraceae bacterium]